MIDNNYTYIPLDEPTPIIEQVWAEGTIPLVATSTLTYNHGSFIRDCLEGILMQKTTFPVRVLIFDDFSTDNTRDILKEYSGMYPNIFYIVLASHNTYGTPERIEAIEPFRKIRKEAKYIALCEGDDYWIDPLKLQKQVELLENYPQCSICFHSTKMKTKTKEYVAHDYGSSNKVFDSEKLISGKINMWTASVLVKNDVVKLIPSNLNKLRFGDVKLKIWAASKGCVAYVGGGPMSVYRRGVKGAWSEKEGKEIEWEKQRLRDHYEIVKAFKEVLPDRYHKALKKYKKKVDISHFFSLRHYYSGVKLLLVMIKNLKYIRYNLFLILNVLFKKLTRITIKSD